jgi:hypothetical protein
MTLSVSFVFNPFPNYTEERMKKKILFFVRLVLCGGMLIFTNSGLVARAQGLSFPAEINKSFTPISIRQAGSVQCNYL